MCETAPAFERCRPDGLIAVLRHGLAILFLSFSAQCKKRLQQGEKDGTAHSVTANK
jgi:hypothetical protein